MTEKLVHLRLKCVDCGKILGEYIGLPFVFGVHGIQPRNIVEKVEILCEECAYTKLKGVR